MSCGSAHVSDPAVGHDERRARNIRLARRLGYPEPPADVPPTEVRAWRTVDEAVDRALVVNVVLSCAHGLAPAGGWTWLRGAGLLDRVTPAEAAYLEDLESGLHLDDLARRLQVEALWALLWAVCLADDLDFAEGCGGAVAPLLPELDDPGAVAAFRTAAERRHEDDLLVTLDLARVLTAALGDDDLRIGYAPGEVEPYVVWERRRALEWLAGADWD